MHVNRKVCRETTTPMAHALYQNGEQRPSKNYSLHDPHQGIQPGYLDKDRKNSNDKAKVLDDGAGQKKLQPLY